MLTDIILIGPYGAGKSTLAELLAERLNWHHYLLDAERSRYLKEMGEYNIDIANQMDKWELSSPKWQRYNIYFVERFLDEHADSDENCVLDLGAGHSVYKDPRFRSRAKQIFAPYPNVVLILPSKNVEESLELLLNQVRNHGLKGRTLSDEQIIRDNRFFLENPSNYELAKFIVYTRGKTPGETCDEIYQVVCSRP
ncbi:MAG: shikimate kinase [Chloroflexi bacterium]|nr:shikimate kinase [Chloroflexota bacterium]